MQPKGIPGALRVGWVRALLALLVGVGLLVARWRS
jgi:hypothetical protein